jgi:hypothetical protein
MSQASCDVNSPAPVDSGVDSTLGLSDYTVTMTDSAVTQVAVPPPLECSNSAINLDIKLVLDALHPFGNTFLKPYEQLYTFLLVNGDIDLLQVIYLITCHLDIHQCVIHHQRPATASSTDLFDLSNIMVLARVYDLCPNAYYGPILNTYIECYHISFLQATKIITDWNTAHINIITITSADITLPSVPIPSATC